MTIDTILHESSKRHGPMVCPPRINVADSEETTLSPNRILSSKWLSTPSRERNECFAYPGEENSLFLPRSRATFKDRDFPTSIVLLFCCNIYLLEAVAVYTRSDTRNNDTELGLCSREREREANGFQRFVSF